MSLSTESPRRYYLIASTYRQAAIAAHQLELPRNHWRFVSETWHLEGVGGLRYGELVIVLPWLDRGVRQDVIDFARYIAEKDGIAIKEVWT